MEANLGEDVYVIRLWQIEIVTKSRRIDVVVAELLTKLRELRL